jgi:hypothetical protein
MIGMACWIAGTISNDLLAVPSQPFRIRSDRLHAGVRYNLQGTSGLSLTVGSARFQPAHLLSKVCRPTNRGTRSQYRS